MTARKAQPETSTSSTIELLKSGSSSTVEKNYQSNILDKFKVLNINHVLKIDGKEKIANKELS